MGVLAVLLAISARSGKNLSTYRKAWGYRLLSRKAGTEVRRSQLLRQAGDFYGKLETSDVKGYASAKLPGWQISVDVETVAAQPQFLPFGKRSSAPRQMSSFSNFRTKHVGSRSNKPLPGVQMPVLGSFADLGRRLLSAQQVGRERVTYEGLEYPCAIIDASYDQSPDFKPHSQIVHKRFSLDPKTLWVFKEVVPDEAVGDWNFVVTSMAFNQPLRSELVKGLESFNDQPKTLPEWAGRDLPKLILTDLTGNQVDVESLRGQPLLLDFWASYCGPCRAATALSTDLAETYGQSGLRVVTATRDNATDARLWMNFHHFSLPVLLDADSALSKTFGISGVPVAILFDRRGKVAKYWIGFDDSNDVRSTVAEVITRHAKEQ